MSTTAATVIGNTLHLFGITDMTESPQPSDLQVCVPILNNLLRAEHADGAAQYLIKRATVQLPPGVVGSVYTFGIGTGQLVNVDAVAMRAMYVNDVSPLVNRETRPAPIADVIRTTMIGMITKWHQERQIDGSVLVTAWQPPRAAVTAIIDYGGRVPPITAVDGSDVVPMPPEGIDDVTLLLGLRVCAAYGRSLEAVGLLAQDARRVDERWRNWARGTQWIRMVRA